MMTIKLQCGCGQKYAFDVEPVDGLIPWTVACPVCGTDGTTVANQVIAQNQVVPEAAPAVAPAALGLRLRSTAPPTDTSLPAAPVLPPAPFPRSAVSSESGGETDKWKWWYYVLGGIFIAGHSIWQASSQESIKPLGELFGAALCIAVGIWDFQRKRKR